VPQLRSREVVKMSAGDAAAIRAAINKDEEEEKNDSWEEPLSPKMEHAEYNQTTFWATPDAYDVDDLLGDMDEDQV